MAHDQLEHIFSMYHLCCGRYICYSHMANQNTYLVNTMF